MLFTRAYCNGCIRSNTCDIIIFKFFLTGFFENKKTQLQNTFIYYRPYNGKFQLKHCFTLNVSNSIGLNFVSNRFVFSCSGDR